MILTKTPLRISFAGGGSDYISKSKIYGEVISVTINKYIYVMVNKKHDNNIRISYSITENVKKVSEIKHDIIRNCLKYCGIKKGIEVIIMGDVPSAGSGLGSSSSLTVGLLNALYKYNKKKLNRYDLALKAYYVETVLGRKKIGLQDHFNAAYGGFKNYKFKSFKKIGVHDLILSKKDKNKFLNKLSLYYTGINRKAGKILGVISKTYDLEKKLALKKETYVFKKSLKNKNYKEIGKVLNKSWEYKKNFGNTIVKKKLNLDYMKAMKVGVYGGKILGAGGGGYFLFISDINKKKALDNTLNKLKKINFNFSTGGSQIIYND